MPRADYRIGVPEPGYYAELLNSDARASTAAATSATAAASHSEPVAAHGFDQSLRLLVPPLGVPLSQEAFIGSHESTKTYSIGSRPLFAIVSIPLGDAKKFDQGPSRIRILCANSDTGREYGHSLHFGWQRSDVVDPRNF